MSATGLERPVRLMRASRRVNMFLVVLNVLILALDLTAGSGLAFAPATVIVVLLALIVAQTRRIGTLRARERDLNRPRMTAEDYRQLREMELELGWEPSEVPADVEVSPYAALTVDDIEEAHERLMPPGPALSAPGSLSAPMTGPGGCWRPLSELPETEATPGSIPGGPLIERMRRELKTPAPGKVTRDDVAYPSEASAHFAALARVGLEHCLSYCPICLYRLYAAGVKAGAGTWQWLEENWGWRQ